MDWRERMKHEHFQKYEEMAQQLGIETLTCLIPVTPEELERALKQDENLNNIPLHLWDVNNFYVKNLAFKAGFKAWSLYETVCVLKHVAKYHFIKGEE